MPAIRVKSWPKFARTESELLTQDIIKQGCHVVQKSDKWRLSFSLAEQTIMNRLSDNLRSAYIEAKVARDPKVTLECVIFEEGINPSSGKPLIDGRKLIPSYLLKLVLFDCIEECHKMEEKHWRSPPLQYFQSCTSAYKKTFLFHSFS